MRIAVNTRLLLPQYMEGIGRFCHEILSRWVRENPQVEFLFLFDRDFDPKFIYADNVKGIKLFPPARHPFLYPIFFEWAVARFLKREKCDIFVSMDGFNCLRSPIKTLLVIHDLAYLHHHNHTSWLTQKYYEFFVPKYLRKADKIVTVSEFSKRDLGEKLGINKDKVAVVYNGVNSLYQPLDLSQKEQIKAQFSRKKPYFIFIGSIHPRKNLVNQLLAFEQFKQKTGADMQFLIVGRMAWNNGQLKTVLERLKYKQDIIFLGYQDSDILPQLLGGAFALCYVSLLEGFGVPIAEAINCEVPVITANNSSMLEVLGKAGFAVEAENVGQIAAAMQSLYEQPELYARCVANAKLQKNRFTWDKSATEFWEILTQTAQS